MTVPRGFEEVEDNVYVNMAYASDADNLITFHVEVTMGTINFELAGD
jgi:hypothetical protein